MPSPNLLSLRNFMSTLMQDTATVSPAMDATSKNSLLNDAFIRYRAKVKPRTVILGNSLWIGAAVAQAATSFETSVGTLDKILDIYQTTTLTEVNLRQLPMERVKPTDLSFYASETAYTLTREQGDNGKWTVYLGAATAQLQTYCCVAHQEVTTLSADTDVAEATLEEGYIFARAAAAQGVVLIGRQDLLDGILSPMDEDVQVQMGVADFVKKPRKRAEDEAA